jgi:hypothetical protein
VLAGHQRLIEQGEAVEDEWQYVNDLGTAWSSRLRVIATERTDDAAPDDVVRAVDRLLDEIARIEDPHRAIDWLSTFPQVVLLALGAEDRPAAPSRT